MSEKHTAVFGIYHTRMQAERSVDDLLAGGFSNDDISVLLPDLQSSKEFAHERNTKAPEGTAAGVTAGGAIGGTLGLLAGIGMLAIPGVGPLIAAGPIMEIGRASCRERVLWVTGVQTCALPISRQVERLAGRWGYWPVSACLRFQESAH